LIISYPFPWGLFARHALFDASWIDGLDVLDFQLVDDAVGMLLGDVVLNLD
jgi:hypothetical protein